MTDIDALLQAKKWKPAQELLYRELIEAPTDHWVWYTLSLAHYEQKHYDLALKCSQRAIELQPNCPLALWHYAGSLSMTGQDSQALVIWNLLLNMNPEVVAEGDCGEGMDHALRLLNDVHYRIGRYYQHHGPPELAREAFAKYLHNRGHGVASTYDSAPVERYLSKLALAS
jgi:tetratricopeptide (TPR) repeat protein